MLRKIEGIDSYMILKWDLWRVQLGLHDKGSHCCNVCRGTTTDCSRTTALQLRWQTAIPATQGSLLPTGLMGLLLQHESSWSFSTSTCMFVKHPHEKHHEENAPNPQQCVARGIKHVPFNATQGTFVWMTCHTSVRGIVPGLILVGNLWVWIESWAFLNYNYLLPNPHYFPLCELWASYSAVCNLESRN